jgi:hypothetical protein
VFTDDDCIADAHFLERYVEACRHSPLKAAFFGRVIVPLEHPVTDYKKNVKKLEVAGFITANCGCRRSVLEHTGGFDEQYRTAWREDSDFYFSLLSSHIETIYLPSAIIIHPARKAQWGISIREQRKSRYNALLYKKFPRYFRKYVKRAPNWLYYFIVFFFFSGIICLGVAGISMALICWGLWLLLTAVFITKRLKGTSKSFRHISEMCVTSLFIPFLSIYWNLRGSLEFRTFYV